MAKKFNYVTILMVPDDSPCNVKALRKTEYARVAKQVTRYHIIGRAADELKRDNSLNLWQDIKPVNGKITFELIVQLPFYLPALGSQNEYSLKTSGSTYVINNRHAELILSGEPNKFYFCHMSVIEDVVKQRPGDFVQTIYLKSLVSTKHRIACESVSDAVETNMKKWLAALNRDVTKLVAGLRYLSSDPSSIPEMNSVEDTCSIYLLAKSGKKIGLLPYISRPQAIAIRPFAKISKKKPAVEKFIENEDKIPHHDFLDAARSALNAGQLSSAVIFGCTACEAAINVLLRDELNKKKCSKQQIKDALNDLRFSQQLQLVSNLLPRFNKQSELIPAINAIRRKRNNVIHRGESVNQSDSKLIKDGIEAVEKLVSNISVLRKRH